MLDELALRKPGWAEGRKVVLGDGQEWAFPRPTLYEHRPVFAEDGSAKFPDLSIRSFWATYLNQLDDLLAIRDPVEQIEAIAGLAAKLLRLNYNLLDDDLGSLLTYVTDDSGEMDDDNREMWAAIVSVAAGTNPPKRSPAGSQPE